MAGDATSDQTSGHKGGNPWHDPKSGRFTSGPTAGASAQANAPESTGPEILVTAPKFQTQGDRPSAGAHHLPPDQLLAAIRQTGLLSLRVAELHAEHAAHFRDTLIKKYGVPAPLAAALAANAEMESGVDASVTQSGKNGKGHGLFQYIRILRNFVRVRTTHPVLIRLNRVHLLRIPAPAKVHQFQENAAT